MARTLMPSPPDRPAMSVLTPAYKAAPHLPGLFDTLAAQTFRDFELVICDDASPDETLQTARELAASHDFPVQLLVQPANSGPSAARNRAIEAARGEILAFLDADDRWHEDKLARQAELFAAQPDATIAGCQGEVVDAGGGFLEMIIPEGVFRHPDPARVLFWDSYLQTSGVAIRRSALAARPFDESLRIAEDRDLWIRTAMEGRLALIEEPMFRYFRGPETQMTRSAAIRYRDTIEMIARNVTRFGDRLSSAERRRALGKSHYDAAEALVSKGGLFPAYGHFGRAALLGYRPYITLQKAAAETANRLGWRRRRA